MRKFLLAAIALGAMTSLAWAEPLAPAAGKAGPVEMTDSMLDDTTAAGLVRKKVCCGNGLHRGFKHPGKHVKKNIAHVNQHSYSNNHANSVALGYPSHGGYGGYGIVCCGGPGGHGGVKSYVSQYSSAHNYSSINQGTRGFGLSR